MASGRAERIALNESMFRTANERLAGWEERHAGHGREPYFCECADATCHVRVEVTAEEYEAVRSAPDQFVIAPGHAVSDVESVVAGNERFEVVKKDPEVRDVVERTDPRRADR